MTCRLSLNPRPRCSPATRGFCLFGNSTSGSISPSSSHKPLTTPGILPWWTTPFSKWREPASTASSLATRINDHDALRRSDLLKLIAGRSPEGCDLASQPTHSRFGELHLRCAPCSGFRDVFIDQFIASFSTPPQRFTLDIDPVDDPAHGEQQLVLFHGFYEQYQYFPSFSSPAPTMIGSWCCRCEASAVHAALKCRRRLGISGGVDCVKLGPPCVHVRGDAGYGMPWMYAVCERLGIDYTFGLSSNAVLKRHTEPLVDKAVAAFEATREPQRLFDAFWYQAGTYSRAVIVKAEANTVGTNRRFVVTNRPGAQVLPEAAYDDYAARGESENRNKELKCGLMIDRTSDHRFMANFFRLYLHGMAFNLLVRLRRTVAAPPPPEQPEPPVEALTGKARRNYFRRRRVQDPLGEGQPCTWRSLLIKVAAEVVVSKRRIVVRLCGTWPYLDWYRRVCEYLQGVAVEPTG